MSSWVRYTPGGVARAARPDGADADSVFVIKAGRSLRLTYQLFLLATQATAEGKQLVIVVEPECSFSDDLAAFVHDNDVVRVQKSASR